MSATQRAVPALVWGTGNLSSFRGSSKSKTAGDAVVEALEVLQSHKVSHIDTAQRYGDGKAEEMLGQALQQLSKVGDARSDQKQAMFTIDTKWMVPNDRALTPEEILDTGHSSSSRLNTTSSPPKSQPISTFYLHNTPHPATSLPAILDAINTLHSANVFTNFGISNFTAAQVQEIHDLAAKSNYVLPTVYQGMYNAVHRDQEADLFPTLRKLGISFRAYSPLAGGFLTKTRDQLLNSETGRFAASLKGTPAGHYRDRYVTPHMLDALDLWGHIAAEEGCSRAEMACRWVVFHSGLEGERGDGVILGASSVAQLNETLGWVEKGRLSDSAVEGVERVWEVVRRGGEAGGL